MTSRGFRISLQNSADCHSPTASIRRHLELEGQATAEALGAVAGISSGRVSALLKQDITAGRIDFIEGYDGEKRVYRHVENPPPPPRLVRAIKQLEELGYTITPPEEQSHG